MKKFLASLILAFFLPVSAFAGTIDSYSNETTLQNADEFIFSQSPFGAGSTKNITYSDLKTLLSALYQAKDNDLTTYAGITPSANVQSLLGAADYAAMRTLLSLVIGTNVQAYDADLTTYAGITPSANVQTILGAADYAAIRTALNLVVSTNVQAYDADLTTYAGITPSANVQSLLSAADYSAMRTLLSLIPGTNVQAYDADLTTYAGITPSADVQSWLGAADYSAMRNLLGTQMSITHNASGYLLSGDSASPGNSKMYGTNGSGVKGWYDQPGGGGLSGLTAGTFPIADSSTSVIDSVITDDATNIVITGRGLQVGAGSTGVLAASSGINFDPDNDAVNEVTMSTAGLMMIPSINLGTAGVSLTNDGDGAVTIAGLGDGFDENMIVNLDDVADEIHISSGTGVYGIFFDGFEIFAVAPDAASNINMGVCNTANECGSMDFTEENTDPAFLIGTEDAFPMALYTNDTNRISISETGVVSINSLAGTYGSGTAHVCISDAGVLSASEAACP